MSRRRPALSTASALILGIVLGAGLTGYRPASLHAQGGDRVGESALVTGPVSIEYNAAKKVQVAQEAVYYLDYTGARLLAAVPSFQQSVGGARVLGDFAERDLVADFSLPRGTVPHFLVTTGTLGAFGEPWAPVYVLETSTRQVAIYRVTELRTGASTRPRVDLLECRPIGKSALPARAG